MTTQKLSEVGWFYHAPPKRPEYTEPIPLPATSQIPGLNQQYDEDEFNDQPREVIFKDTDTKYIRLAKEGGRKDLLVFKDFKAKSNEPKGYPRVNWFYLEDNRYEDEATKKADLNWEFLLPDYMVHDSYKPTDDDVASAYSKKRVPFAQDNMSIFKRDTKSATDKTVKIENDRRQGYGVRNSKPVRVKRIPPTVVKLKTPKEQLKEHKNTKWNPYASDGEKVSAKHQPDMEKLLSYGYCHEDNSWNISPPGSKEKPKVNETGPNRKNKKTSVKVPEKKSTEEKEVFKLSRFKNIPSKVNSFQQFKQSI